MFPRLRPTISSPQALTASGGGGPGQLAIEGARRVDGYQREQQKYAVGVCGYGMALTSDPDRRRLTMAAAKAPRPAWFPRSYHARARRTIRTTDSMTGTSTSTPTTVTSAAMAWRPGRH